MDKDSLYYKMEIRHKVGFEIIFLIQYYGVSGKGYEVKFLHESILA